MSCKICGRSSCTESFHSLDEQALFEQREAMPDDVALLRRMVQVAAADLVAAKADEWESTLTEVTVLPLHFTATKICSKAVLFPYMLLCARCLRAHTLPAEADCGAGVAEAAVEASSS